MPAQKRYSSNYQDEDDDESLYQPKHRRNQRRRGKQSRRRGGGGDGGAEQSRAPGDELEQQQQRIELETGEQEQEEQALNHDQESIKESSEDDSDGSGTGTDPEDFDELISVSRSEIRGNVQCPICLGIIKRTRVVMGCQHRFCRECIDKSMRLGNNECPACRIHCASRRSLRDDPIFDALIQAIYPDVQKYEEEELVFHEEERALNQQIQASIAQISQRQSEALNKKRKLNKELITTTSTPRGSRNYQNAYSRRRRNSQTTELHQSDHNESEDGCMENSTGRVRENQDDSSGHVVRVLKQETFTWGRGGVRSHVRHGSGGSSRNVRANRLSKLTNYLKSGQRNEFQQDAHVQLVSLNVEETPCLEKPYLCCDSNLSVNDIREHIAREVKSQAKDIEIVSLEEDNKNTPTLNFSNSSSELQILPGQETLAGIQSNYHSSKDLTLGYMQKKTNICILD